MQIFRHHPPLAMRHQRVLTIGNFDGVHLGHQAVLAKLKAHALAQTSQTSPMAAAAKHRYESTL
jgi:riboflavin kinase / FMN adenylyltransferase